MQGEAPPPITLEGTLLAGRVQQTLPPPPLVPRPPACALPFHPCRPASGIQELLEAKQLGDNQQGVLDSVKEYYGEVGCRGRQVPSTPARASPAAGPLHSWLLRIAVWGLLPNPARPSPRRC